jgi:hypothetical protein
LDGSEFVVLGFGALEFAFEIRLLIEMVLKDIPVLICKKLISILGLHLIYLYSYGS